jgi:hypothetical protein
MGEGRGEYRILMGRPEGGRPLGRPRRRWEDNMVMVINFLYFRIFVFNILIASIKTT